MDLRDVSILVKTFLRDEYLFHTIESIWCSLPECQMVVIDDGDQDDFKTDVYEIARTKSHKVTVLPFDSGFGTKSNVGIREADRSLILIGSDDFDFSLPEVREGIEKLVDVMDTDPTVGIAAGRVNNQPYEMNFKIRGGRVEEHRLVLPRGWMKPYYDCDLTVNYYLIRKSVFNNKDVWWEEDVKIGGGEHAAQFLKMKCAGVRTVWVPGVNINEQSPKPIDPRYGEFRGRARAPERPCFDRLGITEYVCLGGEIDYVNSRAKFLEERRKRKK